MLDESLATNQQGNAGSVEAAEAAEDAKHTVRRSDMFAYRVFHPIKVILSHIFSEI